MDVKEIADKLAFIEARMQDLEQYQQSDYSFIWAHMGKIELEQRDLKALVSKLQGQVRFEDVIKKAVNAESPKTGGIRLSRSVILVGVGVFVGIAMAQSASAKHKAEIEARNKMEVVRERG
jgi:hypothetical protein